MFHYRVHNNPLLVQVRSSV